MRLRHLGISALAFLSTYPLANHAAELAGVQSNVALPLDAKIPFLPWLIVPYLTSGIFYVACFFLVRNREDLRVLSQRLVLATAGAALIFAIIPMRFSLSRPNVDQTLIQPLFGLLAEFDRPYNQFPSLHVAYCVIFWHALRKLTVRMLDRSMLGLWLGLIALSTVFIYQHHLLDVAGGFALGAATLIVVRAGTTAPCIAFYYFVSAIIVLTVGGLLLHQWPAYYLAASLALVGMAYVRDDRFFLHKSQGRFPIRVWLLYAPYLLGYLLTWQVVRLRERGNAPFVHAGTGLWVGRRLTALEAAWLPANCTVIDLANELSETPALRTNRYLHFPLLDLREPPAAAIGNIVDAMSAESRAGRPIYLHCAMGYSRCRLIARHFLDNVTP